MTITETQTQFNILVYICLITNTGYVLTSPVGFDAEENSLVSTDRRPLLKEVPFNSLVNQTGKVYKMLQQEQIKRLLSYITRAKYGNKDKPSSEALIEHSKDDDSPDDRKESLGLWSYNNVPISDNDEEMVHSVFEIVKEKRQNKYRRMKESNELSTLDGKREALNSHGDGKNVEEKHDTTGLAVQNEDFSESHKPVAKRKEVTCDVSKMTLNMLFEYLTNRTLCGTRTTQVRFGIGK